MTLLKQLAIASTEEGVIGYDGELLFTNSQDMNNFKAFTHNTVMIVGRKTAIEMLGMKCPLYSKRPMVVVSAAGVVPCGGIAAKQQAHLYYADSLEQAIELAERLAAAHDLSGWTIIGGATLYNEVRSKAIQLNRMYVARFEAELSGLNPACMVKLDGSLDWLLAPLKNKMVNAHIECQQASVMVRNSKDVFRANVLFAVITDRHFFDNTGISLNNGILRVVTSQGQLRLPINAVQSYLRLRERNVVEIDTAYNVHHEVRLETAAQVNYLMHLLDSFTLS